MLSEADPRRQRSILSPHAYLWPFLCHDVHHQPFAGGHAGLPGQLSEPRTAAHRHAYVLGLGVAFRPGELNHAFRDGEERQLVDPPFVAADTRSPWPTRLVGAHDFGEERQRRSRLGRPVRGRGRSRRRELGAAHGERAQCAGHVERQDVADLPVAVVAAETRRADGERVLVTYVRLELAVPAGAHVEDVPEDAQEVGNAGRTCAGPPVRTMYAPDVSDDGAVAASPRPPARPAVALVVGRHVDRVPAVHDRGDVRRVLPAADRVRGKHDLKLASRTVLAEECLG
mmetsp:Transcript_36798/g.85256  ORF Transcript_36798/g.85256 Transcript_36798/m.85256 type:complete len:285 (-) Transcript_36798:1556-2410(-)